MPYFVSSGANYNETIGQLIKDECLVTRGVRIAGFIMIVICLLLFIPMVFITIKVK